MPAPKKSTRNPAGDGIGVNPKGYPPTAAYRFELAPRSGHIVLSTYVAVHFHATGTAFRD